MAVDLESLSEVTSGAIGAVISTTLLYPLDTCKTKYQAEVQVHVHQKYNHWIQHLLGCKLVPSGNPKDFGGHFSEGSWNQGSDGLGFSAHKVIGRENSKFSTVLSETELWAEKWAQMSIIVINAPA